MRKKLRPIMKGGVSLDRMLKTCSPTEDDATIGYSSGNNLGKKCAYCCSTHGQARFRQKR